MLKTCFKDSNFNLILFQEFGEIQDVTGSFPIDLTENREQRFKLSFNFPEKFVPNSRKCTLYAYCKHATFNFKNIKAPGNDLNNDFNTKAFCSIELFKIYDNFSNNLRFYQ